MRIVFFGLGLIGVVSAMSVHGTVLIFFDALSLFFVFGSSIVFTLAHHSASEVWDAFAAATGKNNIPPADMKKAIATLSTARVVTSSSGLLGSLIGFVKMLASMDDPSAIGPAMAVAVLSVLYAVVVAEFVIGPLINRLRSAIPSTELDEPLKITTVTMFGFPLLLLLFFTLTSFLP